MKQLLGIQKFILKDMFLKLIFQNQKLQKELFLVMMKLQTKKLKRKVFLKMKLKLILMMEE